MRRAGKLLAAALLLWSPVLYAQTLFDSLLSLAPMQGARVMENSSSPGVEKIYPLGSVQRISGRLRYADELLLSGQREVLTLQLADTHGAADGFAAVRSRLQHEEVRMLFWCEGRDCGPSNLWANSIFGNSRLYGPDERQHYAVFVHPQSRRLVALYATTRGNGRSMLHVEYFTAENDMPDSLKPTPATLVRQLRSGERLALHHLPQPPDGQWLQLLARALNQDRSLRVVLGGQQAREWHSGLLEAGVAGNRIEVEADGTVGLYMQAIQ